MKRYVELNELQKFCKKYTDADTIGQGLSCSTDLLHTVKAIPLDEIEKVREEIDELDGEYLTIYDGTSKIGSGKYVYIEDVLEILDKLILENEVE